MLFLLTGIPIDFFKQIFTHNPDIVDRITAVNHVISNPAKCILFVFIFIPEQFYLALQPACTNNCSSLWHADLCTFHRFYDDSFLYIFDGRFILCISQIKLPIRVNPEFFHKSLFITKETFPFRSNDKNNSCFHCSFHISLQSPHSHLRSLRKEIRCPDISPRNGASAVRLCILCLYSAILCIHNIGISHIVPHTLLDNRFNTRSCRLFMSSLCIILHAWCKMMFFAKL